MKARMKNICGKLLSTALLTCCTLPALLQAGHWQPLVHQPSFVSYDLTNPNKPLPAPGGAFNPRLLTDGSVIVQNNGYWATPDMWKLTPDSYGSYVNGTWTQIASLPYTPTYTASAMLADGRLLVLGGEYTDWDYNFTLTNQGAIYDPVANTWTSITGPDFFVNFYPTYFDNNSVHPIGDAASVVLEDGTFMVCDKLSKQAAIWNPKESFLPSWNEVGTSTKQYLNSEEGWTLLPNGKVLTVNTYKEYLINRVSGFNSFPYPFDLTQSEIYNPTTREWSYAGSTIFPLSDTATVADWDTVPNQFEMGPGVLRPDGTVFCLGSNGNSAIYDWKKETWQQGPRLPSLPAFEYQLAIQDGPGVLLPNGNVFFVASPFGDGPSIHFFEFTGSHLNEQPTIPHATQINPSVGAPDPSYACNMLLLPTGQVLLTDFSNDVEIYTPDNSCFDSDWAPSISSAPEKVLPGRSYKIKGKRFNGMSQACFYGNENQCATNYPLVRITNDRTGRVFYCRTHDHSFMGVASDKKVSTCFDVPANIESGKSTLEVVANGIPSKPVKIRVK